ncbi:MAG: type IV-A pilus assembly ATPase PilB [Wenzhouxiangellaceae bacterium]|nr:type IV-A pilus assembly ATPase PilB [Wenzhouxiangellaceae bacterium]
MASTAESVQVAQLPGTGKRLVQEGLLSEQQALEALTSSQKLGRTFTSHLVREQLVDALGFAHVAAEEFGLPLVDLNAFDLRHAPGDVVKEDLMRKHLVMPIMKRGKRLSLAVADPTNQAAIDEVAFTTGFNVEVVLAASDGIAQAIDRVLAGSSQAFAELTAGDEDLESLNFEAQQQETDSNEETSDDAPIVRFINKVLVDAIRKDASDIHFEPYEEMYRIRFRMDGVLKTQMKPPSKMSSRLSARLKVMSNLDIAERRVPQDGRIKLTISKNRSVDFRVSTCPTLWGEKVVLRILDSSGVYLGPEKLGFDEKQKDIYLDSINKPYGMVLVTGPTGSGKTVSLYTALGLLNAEGVNISTVEDPVEIRMPGVNQVQQNTKQGLTFAAALRSFLRQDPDIIMVGEIRDLETAEIAIKAAQTGHLVLSTLHTNDAPQSITRLANMGVPPYNIVSAVHMVMAQRLARTLHKCKVPEDDLPPEVLKKTGFTDEEIEEGLKLFKAKGCNLCNDGFKGRSGVFQVMPITEEIEQIILSGGTALEIERQSKKEGVLDLRRSALNKVKNGVISLVEMNRVTKD